MSPLMELAVILSKNVYTNREQLKYWANFEDIHHSLDKKEGKKL